jgi:hypothetical protein
MVSSGTDIPPAEVLINLLVVLKTYIFKVICKQNMFFLRFGPSKEVYLKTCHMMRSHKTDHSLTQDQDSLSVTLFHGQVKHTPQVVNLSYCF